MRYGLIHRFSEDIDLKIVPNETLCGFKVYEGKNHDDSKHRDSRRDYFDWISNYMSMQRPSGITKIVRDGDLPPRVINRKSCLENPFPG